MANQLYFNLKKERKAKEAKPTGKLMNLQLSSGLLDLQSGVFSSFDVTVAHPRGSSLCDATGQRLFFAWIPAQSLQAWSISSPGCGDAAWIEGWLHLFPWHWHTHLELSKPWNLDFSFLPTCVLFKMNVPCVRAKSTQSCLTLCDPMDYIAR